MKQEIQGSVFSKVRERAEMFARVRAFFAERNVIEVDCPALSPFAPVDTHIDVMEVKMGKNQTGFLHTSPEYGMKQLLSQGSGDIYQMSHVFRKEESGSLHRPEFTMVEWYRLGFSFEEMIEETLDFARLFLGEKSAETVSYRQAFLRYAKIDYIKASDEELLGCLRKHKVPLSQEAENSDRDTLLQCLMSFVIEPQFPQERLVVLRDYPANQAALAKTKTLSDGEEIAFRFEIYFNGIELANGYDELTDATEQRTRFEKDNEERVLKGKEALPIDEDFLQALSLGLPECCGVAVGFDRLLMLKQESSSLAAILPL
jgi:lysyl-tRNA synthetase class 2